MIVYSCELLCLVTSLHIVILKKSLVNRVAVVAHYSILCNMLHVSLEGQCKDETSEVFNDYPKKIYILTKNGEVALKVFFNNCSLLVNRNIL